MALTVSHKVIVKIVKIVFAAYSVFAAEDGSGSYIATWYNIRRKRYLQEFYIINLLAKILMMIYVYFCTTL